MACLDVAIGIVMHQGRILIAKRKPGAALEGLWEYPGGKVHPGEDKEDCLTREMLEETGLVVQIVHAFDPISYRYQRDTVRLYPFLCKSVSGQAKPLASSQVIWVRPDELHRFPMPPANDSLNQELLRVIRDDVAFDGVEE